MAPWVNPIARSSQCRTPTWRAHINQSHHPDLVSVVSPHGTLQQINSITPIQSRVPMARPHNSIPSPTSSQCCTPMACPHKSIPSLPSSRAPPWRIPINQCHRQCSSQCHAPRKSIPSPWSCHCHKPPWINPIETISAGGRFARPAKLGVHPIWWRWHGNTKSLSKVQSCDV